MARYEEIADDIRRKVREQVWQPGEQLPAEAVLATEYRVTVRTLRSALDKLKNENLIESRHGIGNFVQTPRQQVRRTTGRYQAEKNNARLPEEQRRLNGATELDTGLKVDQLRIEAEFRQCPAPDDVAAAFGVEPGALMLRRQYRTYPNGEFAPLGIGYSWLLIDMIKSNPDLMDESKEPWPGGTHHQLSTVGIEIDRIVDEISARPPDPHEARILGIGPGVSVLALRKISIDTKGRVVEVADALLPGDRTQFVYTTQLERWEG